MRESEASTVFESAVATGRRVPSTSETAPERPVIVAAVTGPS
jgi:hypothetical protein